MKPLSPSAQRVQDALAAAGIDGAIVEYDAPARTSAEAAQVLGCTVGEIAKSLVFRAADDRHVLVIASGAHRIDERRVAEAVGQPIVKADADFVRARTGYAIGGVPPIAHASPPIALVDAALLAYERVFAAGGTPNAMFPARPQDLVRASGGRVVDVALASNR
ncbi:MAG TPA: YbaK/EbsC family protein [Casimicrobiaceae bacterium]|nr:YbaK/EbsC family protein [Casimicrobiaceae bacterium]